jgi:hypothetical protein
MTCLDQRSVLVRFALVTLALGSQVGLAVSDSSPFDTLLGSWSGGGQMRLEGGATERLSCKGYYTGGGSQLSMAIRCASDTNKVEMRSRLRYDAGRVSGSWEERTFNAEGSAAGKATENRVTLQISGTVSGSMSVSFTRNRQDVTIVTHGIPLQGVSITLSRQ